MSEIKILIRKFKTLWIQAEYLGTYYGNLWYNYMIVNLENGSNNHSKW